MGTVEVVARAVFTAVGLLVRRRVPALMLTQCCWRVAAFYLTEVM